MLFRSDEELSKMNGTELEVSLYPRGCKDLGNPHDRDENGNFVGSKKYSKENVKGSIFFSCIKRDEIDEEEEEEERNGGTKIQGDELDELAVTLYSAKDLAQADFFGKSDPFVIVYYGNIIILTNKMIM